jgi:hypothetical protein
MIQRNMNIRATPRRRAFFRHESVDTEGDEETTEVNAGREMRGSRSIDA